MFLLAQNYLTRGFWGDEAWTSLISQLPYFSMLKTTAADFHPPAYYTIVGLVYKFLPATEIVTRSISIFFYLATIFLVFKFARRFKDSIFGVLSALVVLTNPIFFRYAFEARNYTMFAFLATGSIYYLMKLSEKFSKKAVVLYVFFSALGIYTHYYMFFTLAAQGLYVLLFDRGILKKMLGLWLAVFVLYLPWIPFLAKQVASAGASYWIGPLSTRTHYEALLRILGGEEQSLLRSLLFWTSIGLLLFGLFNHLIRRKFERPYLLIWLWAVVPFVLATLPGLKVDGFKLPLRPLFFWRYLIGSSVPLAMLIVHSAEKLNSSLFKISIAAVLVLSVLIDVQTFRSQPYTFREAYNEKIVGQIKPGDKIVTVLPSFAEVLYYRNRLGLTNDVIVLPEGLVQFSGKSLLDTEAQLGVVTIADRPKGKYWELTPGPTITVNSQ